jgi:hypothetical protein
MCRRQRRSWTGSCTTRRSSRSRGGATDPKTGRRGQKRPKRPPGQEPISRPRERGQTRPVSIQLTRRGPAGTVWGAPHWSSFRRTMTGDRFSTWPPDTCELPFRSCENPASGHHEYSRSARSQSGNGCPFPASRPFAKNASRVRESSSTPCLSKSRTVATDALRATSPTCEGE